MINLEKYYTKINRNLFNPDSNKEFLNNTVENTQNSNNIIYLSFAYGLKILIINNLNFEANLNIQNIFSLHPYLLFIFIHSQLMIHFFARCCST